MQDSKHQPVLISDLVRWTRAWAERATEYGEDDMAAEAFKALDHLRKASSLYYGDGPA